MTAQAIAPLLALGLRPLPRRAHGVPFDTYRFEHIERAASGKAVNQWPAAGALDDKRSTLIFMRRAACNPAPWADRLDLDQAVE
jgi:hypothetical protein